MSQAIATHHSVLIGSKRVELELSPHSENLSIVTYDRPQDQDHLSTRISGVNCVCSELEQRGYKVQRHDQRDSLFSAIKDRSGRLFAINTSRFEHQWVTDWAYGDTPDINPQRLRVLVDLLGHPVPTYYILWDYQFKYMLRNNRREYLAKHGGQRPLTPESGHTNILADDENMQDGYEAWDRFDNAALAAHGDRKSDYILLSEKS